jgi:glyoxalase family protein
VGFEGVRAYASDPRATHYLLTGALRFSALADNVGYRVRGGLREGLYHYDQPPVGEGFQGAGTVHHIAWASSDEDHESWRERVIAEGIQPTPIIDRLYFQSVYFREPNGVLFELATLSPGFTVDEPAEHLGESLQLPPQHEHLRAHLEHKLTPITNPRAATADR